MIYFFGETNAILFLLFSLDETVLLLNEVCVDKILVTVSRGLIEGEVAAFFCTTRLAYSRNGQQHAERLGPPGGTSWNWERLIARLNRRRRCVLMS